MPRAHHDRVVRGRGAEALVHRKARELRLHERPALLRRHRDPAADRGVARLREESGHGLLNGLARVLPRQLNPVRHRARRVPFRLVGANDLLLRECARLARLHLPERGIDVARRNEFLPAPVHKMREPSLLGILENRRQGGGGDFRRVRTQCRAQGN